MTKITKRHVLVLILCASMVLAAGCAGWGTDGPADSGDGNEQTPNETTDSDSPPNETTQNTTPGSSTDTNATESGDDTANASGGSDGSSAPEDNSSDESAEGTSDTPATDDSSDDGSQSPTEDTDSDSNTDGDPNDCQTCPAGDDGDGDGESEPAPEPSEPAEPNESTGNESEPAPTEPNESTGNESEPSAPETHNLTVSVTDESGKPIEGADVSVATYDGGADVDAGTTNSDGTVTFSVENGSYEVLVDHEDYLPNASDERLVEVDGSDATHAVTLSEDTEAGNGNGNETAPNESTGNESTNGEYDRSATGVIKVVDENGEPIEGEPVTYSNWATVQDSQRTHTHTNEDGEVRIELLAGDPSDVVMFDVEVRGEEKTLGIMSDEHQGVQEVVYEVERNPGEYTYSYTVQVVDENGHPVEGEEVRIGTPGEGTHNYTTNQHGEVSDSFMNSAKGDVVMQEVIVRGESYTMHVERGNQSKVIEVSSESAPGNETAPNESGNESAAAA